MVSRDDDTVTIVDDNTGLRRRFDLDEIIASYYPLAWDKRRLRRGD